MKRMTIGPWLLEVDLEQTKEFYDNFHLISDDCTCTYCANYMLLCEEFPREVKELFDSLGVNPYKEGEVTEFMENEDGTHLYLAFYHIVGRILEGPKLAGKEAWTYDLAGFEISFSDDLDLVPKIFPEPTIQLELEMNLPWLLGS